MIETIAHPTAPSAPEGARPAGAPPFLRPGAQIDWHYRRPGWTAGDASTIAPMRVVRDDPRGLVAWLAPGTVQEAQGAPDGRRIRTVPLERRWTERRIRIREEWWGNGILRIAPTGTPWSVWLFWSGEPWTFSGWYVNLENAHLRAGEATYSSDHVLDVWIDAAGHAQLKDEDELEEALVQGRIAPEEAAHIRRHAEAAIASFAAGDWPFDPAWRDWRPDPSWTTPTLADLPD
ncbi:hypothetical protein GCM10017576_27180 [Microbacterium barkeri]|uniref:DUF402 domain-containing protein n=2 Tax=Microbacterium barkeri TaxID=33917 RepID=A0A9W6H5C9_9MICO|nr:DUF402 domain-containing protein [Microbacterium barkeri]MDR6875455.1 hypothetical protein [Microbacterium barkeri]GLJ62587.1 hypothetical protein GCM10017576_27180 [Microbacterium barkeri]